MYSVNGNANQWFLQHGWGFDSNIWKPWLNFLPVDDTVLIPDRGYFGGRKHITSENITHPLIVACHSLGLHFLTNEILDEADYIIIVAGFDYFHPEQERMGKRSRMIIRKMLQRLEYDPKGTLEDFYTNCWNPEKCDYPVPSKINDISLLKEDLHFLNEHKWNTEKLKNHKKILILHGDSDRIVSINKGERLHQRLENSTLIKKEKSGHAIIATHAEWCINQIEEFIKD